MEDLPLELFYELILKLNPESLLNLCKTSSTINQICSDQSNKTLNFGKRN